MIVKNITNSKYKLAEKIVEPNMEVEVEKEWFEKIGYKNFVEVRKSVDKFKPKKGVK